MAGSVWAEIAPQFTRGEFRRPDDISTDALRRLHRTRLRAGVPMVVVSDARAGGVGVPNSAHDERPCTAFDIRARSSAERYAILLACFAGEALAALEDIAEGRVSGDAARELARSALAAPGYDRIGVYPPTAAQKAAHGKNAGSIHVDSSRAKPRRVCWVDY